MKTTIAFPSANAPLRSRIIHVRSHLQVLKLQHTSNSCNTNICTLSFPTCIIQTSNIYRYRFAQTPASFRVIDPIY